MRAAQVVARTFSLLAAILIGVFAGRVCERELRKVIAAPFLYSKTKK